jgi:hypothetical protein
MYIWCQCDDENGVSCRFIKLNKNQNKKLPWKLITNFKLVTTDALLKLSSIWNKNIISILIEKKLS